jgi:hypothetical protein
MTTKEETELDSAMTAVARVAQEMVDDGETRTHGDGFVRVDAELFDELRQECKRWKKATEAFLTAQRTQQPYVFEFDTHIGAQSFASMARIAGATAVQHHRTVDVTTTDKLLRIRELAAECGGRQAL